MTYAYQHIQTFTLASDTASVAIGNLADAMAIPEVKSIELRIEGISTATSGDYDFVSHTIVSSGSVWDSSFIAWDDFLFFMQSNAAYNQTGGIIGQLPTQLTSPQTPGSIVCLYPHVYRYDDSFNPGQIGYGMLTGLSKSNYMETNPTRPILAYSNMSYTTTGYMTSLFNSSARFQLQNGSFKAGTKFSFYGWC